MTESELYEFFRRLCIYADAREVIADTLITIDEDVHNANIDADQRFWPIINAIRKVNAETQNTQARNGEPPSNVDGDSL